MIEIAIDIARAIGAFLFVFSIVVVIHELGHYWAARMCGVKIETFSIGFGKASLVSWRDKHDTVWRIAPWPLGGYVRFWGDANAASTPDRTALEAMRAQIEAEHGEQVLKRVFHFKPVWQRMFVTAAGPLANFLLAIAIFAVMAGVFGEQQRAARIGGVVAESPAEVAGLQEGDLITAIDGRTVRYFNDVVEFVMLRGGDQVEIVVDRAGTSVSLPVIVGRNEREDAFGRPIELGFLGVRSTADQADVIVVRHGPVSALVGGVQRTWRTVEQTGRFVARLITGRESTEHLGGVLRIADMAGNTAKAAMDGGSQQASALVGLANAGLALLTLAAFLSVSIGLLNLLPIPILDGGHLVYYAYEAAVGRPIDEAVQEWGFRIGLALVLGLTVFVTWNDLRYLRVFDAFGVSAS